MRVQIRQKYLPLLHERHGKTHPMPDKKIKESLSGIVDKMNATYDGFIGKGFNLGLNRRVVPVMTDGTVTSWKMQRREDDVWVDLPDGPFETMEELIAFYKKEG